MQEVKEEIKKIDINDLHKKFDEFYKLYDEGMKRMMNNLGKAMGAMNNEFGGISKG